MNKLSKRNKQLLTIATVVVVTLLLLVWRFTANASLIALQKETAEMQAKVPKLAFLHRESGLSKTGLNLSEAAIQDAFNEAVGRFGAQGVHLNYNEEQDQWQMNVQNVSGQALLRVLDTLSQHALLVDNLSLQNVEGQSGKVGGSVLLTIPTITP